MGEKLNPKVIYTAIFGNRCGLVPQPKLAGFDYICFTDQPNLKAKPWKIIQVEPFSKEDCTRSNRFVKIMAHEFVSDYETSIYIDANFLILDGLEDLIKTYLKNNNMAVFSHAQTIPDNRNCIYKECSAIKDLRAQNLYYKEDPIILQNHLKLLKEENYPAENGLIKGGCLIRNHNQTTVKKLMEDWWFMVKNFSKRDQMSFNYVAWKNDFQYATIPGDIRRGNPYIYWLGNHRKAWSMKIAKVQLKRKIGLIKIPEG